MASASKALTGHSDLILGYVAAAADELLAAADLVTDATSFGGIRTTAERRARWGSDDIPEGWVRLSAGCEQPDELLRDVSEALARALEHA